MNSKEEFDRWVSVYKPQYYEGVYEMEKLLRAEDRVFGSFNAKINQTLYDEFVEPASVQGVELFENQLSIIPETGQTLEERKQNILLHMLPAHPITARFMRALFKQVLLPVTFDVAYSERVALVTGKLEDLTKARLRQLDYLLNVYLPANMGRKIEIHHPDELIDETLKVHTGFVTVVSTTIKSEVE